MKRFIVIALLLLAVPACGLDPYSVNPSGTDAQVWNRLYLEGSTVRACMQMTLLTELPASPLVGDMWIWDDGASTHAICWQTASGTYCADAAPAP